MSNALFTPPHPSNEAILSYAPGTPERAGIKQQLQDMGAERVEIPLIIGGEEIRTGRFGECIMPHDHTHVLARYHQADASHVVRAVEASQVAWKTWSEFAWEDRAAVFLKAAELLAGPWRNTINAATMLGQSKNVFQAEIDAACELIDFFRFNVHYAAGILREQPMYSPPPMWNRCEYRPLEGFVFAVTPFNFTSIAGNLNAAPALMGNVSLWKPSGTSVFSGYYLMKLFEAAGLPPGVINFIPGPSTEIGPAVLNRPDLAGIHFTGSTKTFQHLWRSVGENIADYRGYPRLVGETGGKDFIFAHQSADPEALKTAIIRGAFEYQGQKCSAASRAYIPQSLWARIKDDLTDEIKTITMGDVQDFRNFMGAVIDARAFAKIKGYIVHAEDSNEATIVVGGGCDDSHGYFIEPTIIETSNPRFNSMCEEIFGPVISIYPYPHSAVDEALQQCDSASPYALTGAVFATDRAFIAKAGAALRHTAGNFYINDKPTGAVVGQQPFGGGRASGTNDKAGSALNLQRWVNVRTIKESFVVPTDYRYPHQKES